MSMGRAEYRIVAVTLALSIPMDTETVAVSMIVHNFSNHLEHTYRNFNRQKFQNLFWDTMIGRMSQPTN